MNGRTLDALQGEEYHLRVYIRTRITGTVTMKRATLALASMAVATSLAQASEVSPYQAAFESIAGMPRAASSSDALFVFGDLITRVDVAPGLADPVQILGTVKERAVEPVDWFDRQLILVPSADPAKDPTAPPVPVIVSLNAAIYEVTSADGSREVLGLEVRFDILDPDGGTIITFDPWIIDEPTVGGSGSIGELLDRLARRGILVTAVPSPNPNPNPECVLACERDYDTAIMNISDEYLVDISECHANSILALGGGCISGGALGGSLGAGAFSIPLGIGGCALGGMVSFATFLYLCQEGVGIRQDSRVREADRDLLNCLADCGVVSY
jgi:hypothetical protein